MTTQEIFTYITAFVGMTASCGSLLVAAFIFYRVRDDYSAMQKMSEEIAELSKVLEENEFISDQIANVLYDLYYLFASVKAHIELTREGFKIDDSFFDDIERQISFTEKHFAELGLLSRDAVRRKSVQQSLANMFGDFETVEVMNKILSRRIGKRDDHLNVALDQLKRRLKQNRVYLDSSIWTGRPSGGAF